ncbi:MAG: tripartite tricarboxylate transporter TctB family protein [Burkholderiaceae bacterium]|nr:tripartite tricarboxylate transporter TctB family protein [Burkholderiaceae bacterium]
MKKSDFPVIAIIYAIGFWFLSMTMELPEEAQTYPLVLISALLAVNTIYMVRQYLNWRQTRQIENDVAKSFGQFIPMQFFGMVAWCVGYLVLMDFTGYYLTTFVFLVGSMLFLKVPKLHIAITVAALALMTYVVFTWFLKVPLPVGTLFGG